ncbi:hypothetical protein [Streptomyces sp. Rer75]|nr:hypothetical protein [Streptomyces sp. Rer75]QLH21562.1 hypothetical protein HYQ63_13765 [Streptomyces sp. Rer75]
MRVASGGRVVSGSDGSRAGQRHVLGWARLIDAVVPLGGAIAVGYVATV